MIYKKCIITIAKNTATLDEDIYLFRLDKNIELHFSLVNNKYKFEKSDLNNIIAQTNAAYFQVRLYKSDEIKYTFAIQATQDGVAILTITDDLIDDPIELGDYDFQISLLDADKTSMVSMPIVSKQLHVCEPLVSEDAVMGKAVLGLSKAAKGEIKNAFDSQGNYIREIHNDGEVISAQLFNKFEEALETNTKAIKNGTGTTPTVNSVEPELMDMPRIYFSEGTLPTSKNATVMKFDYYSKTAAYHGYVDIKCQGNSSMSYPKKKFTIKPYQDKAKTKKLKIDFKGWGKQSKFVLKANWIDLTHARNVVSARLWGDIIKTRSDYTTAVPELLRTSPNQGAIDGFPVLVYSNGVYQGRYTLNIPKDKWMSNMDDALDTHCILCGENYQSGCFRALPNINGSDWTDELHDVVPAAIKTSWTNAIKFVMNSTDDEFKTNLSNYFDVNSLIDYLLYGIVSTNLDGYGKNQIYFTYDGVHWIASVYDLDSTWGLWWNGGSFVATTYSRKEFQDHKDGQGNQLYDRLEKLFIPQLKARYTELRKDVLSVSHIIQKFEEFNDVCPKDIVQEDYASTTGGGKFTGMPSTTTNNIQQIRSNIVARLTYVDSYINALQDAIPCTNVTLDKAELQFTSLSMPDEVIDITKNASKGYSVVRGAWMIENQGLTFGSLRVSPPDTTTDFIPFTSNNTLTVAQPTSQYGCGAVAYDSDKKAISCYTANNTWEDGNTSATADLTATSINIKNPPANTAYIRLCFSLTDLSNVIVTKKYDAGTTSQEKLIATVTPTNTTDKVVWSVNPTGICTVNNGVVTSIKNGQCTITATCGTQSATCNVTVNLPVEAVTALNLDKDNITLGDATGADTSNVNLLDGVNSHIDTTTNNIMFDYFTLDAGVYVFKNINEGTFTWLGAKYNDENHETGNITDEIIFNFDENKSVQLHAFPDNKSTNTVDKLGLYKLGKLINPIKFTVAGNGYYNNGNFVEDDNNVYSTAVNLDASKKYVLMNEGANQVNQGFCAWKIDNGSGDKNVTNVLVNSPIKLFENITSLSVSINTANNSLEDLTLYEPSFVDTKYEDTLTAALTPANAANKNVTWTVNNENVELVSNGLNCTVKAKAVGSSVVTCTSQDTTNGTIADTCNITVTDVSAT